MEGEIFNIAAGNEYDILEIAERILAALGKPRDLIQLVTDRPGHDRRYAMTAKKIEERIGFRPRVSFEAGLRETVDWYVEHRAWWERIKSGAFRDYYDRTYANR